jgi:hypothetical protein
MAIYKELSSDNIKVARSFLSQLVEVLQQDISGSSTRKKYQHFVTGAGVAPGVTSSLFQTVYDQDFTLQTTNAQFDVTVGLFQSGTIASTIKTSTDSAGKMLFPSNSLMMREKVDVYRQMAQLLLGDASSQFSAPFDSSTSTDLIDAALFISFRRLFARDKIKRETFAMKFYKYANVIASVNHPGNIATVVTGSELTGAFIYTDVGSANNRNVTIGGEVGSIVESSNTSNTVGLLFYDRGIAVLDLAKIMSGSQRVSGSINSVIGNSNYGLSAGSQVIGFGQSTSVDTSRNPNARFIPDFLTSGSIDNIVDHICGVRFHTGSVTAITFQNITNINSTLVSVQAGPDEFNYSSNPTFRDSDDRITVIEAGQEDISQTFVFVTSVGLYDANDNLLAVAKLSRPVEKSPERGLNLRVRLDY